MLKQQKQFTVRKRSYIKSLRYLQRSLRAIEKVHNNSQILKNYYDEMLHSEMNLIQKNDLAIIKNQKNKRKNQNSISSIKDKKVNLSTHYFSTAIQEKSCTQISQSKFNKSFIFKSNDLMIKHILQNLGWVQLDFNSIQFTLKWTQKSLSVEYNYLKSDHYVNHIKQCSFIIHPQSLNNKLKYSNFYLPNYDLGKEQNIFQLEFTKYALFILLKKLVKYICSKKIKNFKNSQIQCSLYKILSSQNFRQDYNNKILINIRLVIQACIFYQNMLYKMKYEVKNKINRQVSPECIQSLLQYSKVDLEYQQSQQNRHQFFYSSITNNKKSMLKLKKSRLETPSEELMRLLIWYHTIFQQNLKDYDDTNYNIWYLIDKNNPLEPKKQLIYDKKLEKLFNKHNYVIQKVINIENLNILKINTFVLIIFKNYYSIDYLNKHLAHFEKIKIYSVPTEIQKIQYQKISQNLDLEQLLKQLGLKIYNSFIQQIQNIISKSIDLKKLQPKINSFQIIKFTTYFDNSHNLMLEKIQNDVLLLSQFGNTQLSKNIGFQLIDLIFEPKYDNYIYWNHLSDQKMDITIDQNFKQSGRNSFISLSFSRQLNFQKNIRVLATMYRLKLIKQLIKSLKITKKNYTGKQKESVFYDCLASSKIQRLFKKQLRFGLIQIFKMVGFHNKENQDFKNYGH